MDHHENDDTGITATSVPKLRLEPRHSPSSPFKDDTNSAAPSTTPCGDHDVSLEMDCDADAIAPINPFDSPRPLPKILFSKTFPSLHVVTDAGINSHYLNTPTETDEAITLTPTRSRSKSVTFLASGCDAVSPLNPFDSPIKTIDVSPIKQSDLGHSFPDCLNNSNDADQTKLRPIRRHTIASDDSPKQFATTESGDQTAQTQRSNMSSQPTADNSESPCPDKYRYCICSNICMRITRRICRPHVSRPFFLHCLPPCHNKIQPHHQRIICRSLIIIFMIITITFTLLDLLILHQYLHVWLEGVLDWLAANPIAGGLVFIGLILLASLCFFPVSLLALGAGFVYIDLYGLGVGIVAATLVCYSGCLLGAAVCFARSRYLMRQLIQKFANRYPIVRAVDRAFESMGFRLFLLLRLSPAMPFNALNYIGGITAVSFRDYWRATCIGILPGLLWTIFVGATFGTINARGVDGNQEFDRNSVRRGVVLGLGIGLGVMGLIGTGIYARQELTKIILAEQAAEQAETSITEEAALRLQSSREDQLTRNGNSSASLYDLENPQLGESFHDDEMPTNESFLDNSARSLHNESSVARKRDAIPQRDVPWSPEAIALELPIMPQIFRRRIDSNDMLETAGNKENNDAREGDVTQSEMGNTQQSEPFELHLGERILNEIPFKWEKGDNNRYHLTNRPRSNTDPISSHVPISRLNTSYTEGLTLGQHDEQNPDESSIRRLHSIADLESLSELALADQKSSSQAKRRSSHSDVESDREWFWIWD